MEFLVRSLKEVPIRASQEPVHLNIYDIHGVSRWTSAFGLGLFHTGVVVFSHEFSYGGHDKVTSGIYKIPPRELSWLGDGMTYKTTIHFGKTGRTQKEVYDYLCRLGKRFRGIDYNLLQQNCNHFADEFLYFLVKRHLPSFVNRVARSFHYVFSPLIPKSWVQYPCASSASSSGSSASNSNSDSSASPSQAPISSSAVSHDKNKGQSAPPKRRPLPPPLKQSLKEPKPIGVKAGVAEMNFRTISNDESPIPSGILRPTNHSSCSSLMDVDGDGDSGNDEWTEDPPALPLRSRSLPRRLQHSGPGNGVLPQASEEWKGTMKEPKRSQSCSSSLLALDKVQSQSFWKFREPPIEFAYLD